MKSTLKTLFILVVFGAGVFALYQTLQGPLMQWWALRQATPITTQNPPPAQPSVQIPVKPASSAPAENPTTEKKEKKGAGKSSVVSSVSAPVTQTKKGAAKVTTSGTKSSATHAAASTSSKAASKKAKSVSSAK